MKKVLFVSALSAMAFFGSCSKDDLQNQLKTDVVGSWRLVADTLDGVDEFDSSDACYLKSTYEYNEDQTYLFTYFLTGEGGTCETIATVSGNYEFPYTEGTMILHREGHVQSGSKLSNGDTAMKFNIEGNKMTTVKSYGDGSIRHQVYLKQ